MPVTMRDVARMAGVSIKTVSRVVNEQGEIAVATRQRVIDAINELGYRPNRLARALITQRTHTVGLVIPDITNPFFPEVARGVQDLAQEYGYNVFICNTDGGAAATQQALYSLAEQGADGVIVFPAALSDDSLGEFADTFRPVVTINHFLEHLNVASVLVRNYDGAQIAVEYLLNAGHVAIGIIAADYPHRTTPRRVLAYMEALQKRGLPVRREWIAAGPTTLDGGYLLTHKLLAQYPEITAIFAYNDLMAAGAIGACKELGRRVPEECAIVGFDDIQLATVTTPTLTTMRVDKYALGRQAMARMLNMLEYPSQQYAPVYIDMELVVREST
ncbi:MAG: LacI family DNA-binding transcriptional regulator [Caldilineaceae bacterium]